MVVLILKYFKYLRLLQKDDTVERVPHCSTFHKWREEALAALQF